MDCLLQVQADVLDGIQEQLKQIRVYGVEKVITYLSYRGERIPSSEVRTNWLLSYWSVILMIQIVHHSKIQVLWNNTA